MARPAWRRATAVRAAELGYKTIVISTDAAHSLADSFDVPLGPEPVAIAPNLWGQEVDVLREMEVHWSTVRGLAWWPSCSGREPMDW